MLYMPQHVERLTHTHVIFRIALNKVSRLMLSKLDSKSNRISINVKDSLNHMLNIIKMGEKVILNRLI